MKKIRNWSLSMKIVVSILSILILSVKSSGVSIFLLNEQNPLSVTTVICRQSFKTWRSCVLKSSVLKFNFLWGLNLIGEVIRASFPCPGLLGFLRNLLFLKKKTPWNSNAIAFIFLKKLNLDCSMWILERLDF